MWCCAPGRPPCPGAQSSSREVALQEPEDLRTCGPGLRHHARHAEERVRRSRVLGQPRGRPGRPQAFGVRRPWSATGSTVGTTTSAGASPPRSPAYSGDNARGSVPGGTASRWNSSHLRHGEGRAVGVPGHRGVVEHRRRHVDAGVDQHLRPQPQAGLPGPDRGQRGDHRAACSHRRRRSAPGRRPTARRAAPRASSTSQPSSTAAASGVSGASRRCSTETTTAGSRAARWLFTQSHCTAVPTNPPPWTWRTSGRSASPGGRGPVHPDAEPPAGQRDLLPLGSRRRDPEPR